MTDAKYIGKDLIHPRIWEKARGEALFAADLAPADCLVLKALRAGRHHAEIVSIDCAAAEKLPGVVRVFTAADIPGRNAMGIINKDHPVLAVGKVRSWGDAVALVAAETEEAAQAALRAIKVEWKELPAILDPREALAEGAAKIHAEGNLLYKRVVKRGDVDAAFAQAHHVVEKSYKTPFIEHCYMEPDAGFGYMSDDGVITIEVCTQNPHYDLGDVSAMMGLPEEKIRVIQAVTGGGFGGKLDISVQGYIALAVHHLKRPVRYFYNKEEAFLATCKRHPMWIDIKTAVDKDGKLLATKCRIIEDGGAYGSYGIAVATRAAVHATGPYDVPNTDIEALEVYTNNTFTGAMRGFGTPQIAFAYESQMDLHAQALGLDPVEIRFRNALRPGAILATGQQVEHSLGLPDCLEAVRPYYNEAVAKWAKETPSSPSRRRGVGVGAMWYGVGNTAAQNPSTAQIAIDTEGAVTVFTGCADIGQGSSLVLLQMAGEILGIHPDKLKLVSADTKFTTNAGASSASRQTYISGNAVCIATASMADMLLTRAVDRLKVAKDDLELHDFTVRQKSKPEHSISFAKLAQNLHHLGLPLTFSGFFDPVTTPLTPEDGQGVPYATYAFACQMAQVEVDVLTGEVDVKKVVAAHDVGRAISPINLAGQIAGGVAIGQGYALLEEFEMGTTESLKDYHLATTTDMPEVVPILVEAHEPSGPFGAKGIGEPSLIPTAPAIVNAIDMALGQRIYALPASLERVLEASKAAGHFDKFGG
ncbi:MAG: xanthine dehydrogenase family protein molybdopterin-binding subunit [Candidatus Adiutrix sp.]|jgi:CO/xanthine dehydrogenase Mo-binding subunit|nr:xanthine dehydrogenase family protein molybdopterin-binding subunit [Candidatus Adiutrix sp.]